MKLYLNEQPRTFVVVSDKYALIVRHPYPTYKSSHHHHLHKHSTQPEPNANKVIVEFVRKEYVNFSKFKDITPSKYSLKKLLGFLGLFNEKGNMYMCFITESETVATPTLGENVLRITGVDFYCLNNDEWDYMMYFNNDEEYQRLQEEFDYLQSSGLTALLPQQQQQQQPQQGHQRYDPKASSVRRFLSSGSFYYSSNFDITSNLQERGVPQSKPHFKLIADSTFFKRYQWNHFMNAELIEFRNRLTHHEQIHFDRSGFLVTMIRGYAQTVNTKVKEGEDALLTLISKQACTRKGPIFGDWGCDDDGSVANFVETEVVIYSKNYCMSYVLTRGNVPIYWEIENSFSKKTLITSKKTRKIVFPSSFEATQVAFGRHFDQLAAQFGEVHVINSLSQDLKHYKGQLNEKYLEHIESFNNSEERSQASTQFGGQLNYRLGVTNLPIATLTMRKAGYTALNPSDIVPKLQDAIMDYGALFYDFGRHTYIGKQLGVFRINSFDNLDKANYLSKIVSQEVIELAFRDMGTRLAQDLLVQHAGLWHENEVWLARITTPFVSTKMPPTSGLSGLKSSVKTHFSKKYLGVVDLKANETAVLKLLGRMSTQTSITLRNPIHDYVQRELQARAKEYSSFRDICVYATTFNVNGSCTETDIREWIFPSSKYEINKSYDLVFVGIQEIVELSAGQMVNTQSQNRMFWEKKIKECLNQHNPEGVKYVPMWGGQLGGIALLLFIKEKELSNVSNIEGAYKKTGFGGMSANKGGVAISFRFADTDVCLVLSHLAAGLSNVDERHQNYKTIDKGIKFLKNRRIRDHNAVIWLGDFNYRIGLLNEQVKPLISEKQYAKIFEYDQLNKQMANGATFPFFDEMEIKFPPTYKFDNGTKTYDTSEKQRVPAWTDRILSLSRTKCVKQLVYDCASEILFSDHRPVFAIFNLSIHVVNEAVKRDVSTYLYDTYRQQYGDANEILTTTNLSFLFDETDQLPPPSTDQKKWWIEGGQPVKVLIPELNKETCGGGVSVINPRRPINPFAQTDEPEFVSKVELLQMLG